MEMNEKTAKKTLENLTGELLTQEQLVCLVTQIQDCSCKDAKCDKCAEAFDDIEGGYSRQTLEITVLKGTIQTLRPSCYKNWVDGDGGCLGCWVRLICKSESKPKDEIERLKKEVVILEAAKQKEYEKGYRDGERMGCIGNF